MATHDELVKAIRLFAEEHGIEPGAVGRDAFKRSTKIGKSDFANTGSNWSKAKAEAIGPLAPDAPPVEPIPHRHHLHGVSTLVDRNGEIVQQWVKTRANHETRLEVMERLLTTLPAVMPARKAATPRPNLELYDDLLAVYPLGDPHIGMLSWGVETGTDFNLEKAQHIMCSAIDVLATNAPNAKHALVVNLGDFFHSDSQENRTRRAGHQLDVDSRWSKVLQVGLDIMIYLIDKCLACHETVHVINEIGNHDDHSAVFLSVALSCYYKNEPRVTIDLSPARFHFHRFGKVLFGVTHGDGAKGQALEGIMATDRAQDWGETKHRHWLCGHVHHSSKLDLRGCTIESFRTLAAQDAWAHGAGYRAIRDMQRIVYHREYGETSRTTVTADYLESMYRE